MKKSASKIDPFGDRVFCQRVVADDKSVGGIIIPETSQKKPQKAVVVAVGPGSMLPDGRVVPLNVVPGMKVLLGEHAGTEIQIDDENYTLVHEHEILGAFTEEAV